MPTREWEPTQADKDAIAFQRWMIRAAFWLIQLAFWALMLDWAL